MQKLLMKVTMRLPEDMYAEIRQYAEVDHRPLLHQARHFLVRGLEQRRREAVHTETAEFLSLARPKAPQRGAAGQERRKQA